MKIVFQSPETMYSIPSLMRSMAIYFCKFRPTNSSNLYTKFLTNLRNSIDDILFSTLNYELLFEFAGKNIGLDTEYFEFSRDKLKSITVSSVFNGRLIIIKFTASENDYNGQIAKVEKVIDSIKITGK
jgi:hypothetical protein